MKKTTAGDRVTDILVQTRSTSGLVVNGAWNMGKPLHPRPPVTDPGIDSAAWSVASAILHEPRQAADRLLALYTLRIPVRSDGRPVGPGETPVALAHEWDARRILNDRVLNWMYYLATSQPGRLGHGRLVIDVYHRCHVGCEEQKQDLLVSQIAKLTPYRLTGCPTAGTVHLCRVRPDTCLSLRQTTDTTLVCRCSGLELTQSVGVIMTWDYEPVGGASERQRAVNYNMGTDKAKDPDETTIGSLTDMFDLERLVEGGAHVDVFDPVNRRRAVEIEIQIACKCPQIASWNPHTGELVLDMISASLEPHPARFDPWFLWGIIEIPDPEPVLAKKVRQNELPPPSQPPPPPPPPPPHSLPAELMPSIDTLEDRERETVERVLEDILWDADRRLYLNMAMERRVRCEIRDALAYQLVNTTTAGEVVSTTNGRDSTQKPGTRWPIVLNLLQALAKHNRRAVCNKQVMTLCQVNDACARGAVDGIVSVPVRDKTRHRAMVRAILYLWSYVFHDSNSDRKRNHRRRRPEFESNVTLSQFSLGFLYTAATTGIHIGDQIGWPRDWWLHDHLPPIKSVHWYGRAVRESSSFNRRNDDAAATTDRISQLFAFDKTHHGHTNNQVLTCPEIYATRDVTDGKSAVINLGLNYTGQLPSGPEAAAILRGMCDGVFSCEKKSVGRSVSSSQARGPLPTTTTTTLQTMSLRFCCLYTAQGETRVHVCVSLNPTDTPPGLTKELIRREGWALDLVIGPFVREDEARKFCINWARASCNVAERRRQGRLLAACMGLQVWGHVGTLPEQQQQQQQQKQQQQQQQQQQPPPPAAAAVQQNPHVDVAFDQQTSPMSVEGDRRILSPPTPPRRIAVATPPFMASILNDTRPAKIERRRHHHGHMVN